MKKIIFTFTMISMLAILNEDTTGVVTPVVTESPSVNDNQEDA